MSDIGTGRTDATATATSPTTDAEGGKAWLTTAEKGSVIGIRFLVFVATVFGRGFAGLFLRVVALYYVTFHGKVRRALRAYYLNLDGSVPGFWALWRHVFGFARVALDRFFFARGKGHLFALTYTGREHLEGLIGAPRGSILLSAHLGSQAAMAADDASEKLRINIVGYFKNARMLNAVMTRLNPHTHARVIHVEPGSVTSVLAIKDRVDRGETLVIAGDRIGLNDKSVEVDFLGKKARFPTGPFVLASVLRCPVYLAFALYRGGNRYDLFCEPLSPAGDLLGDAPRSRRDAAIAALVQRYADRLGHYCRLAPDNWYNFYDFWGPA